jgi:hypothetical protein
VTALGHRPSNAALCHVPVGLASQQDIETDARAGDGIELP